MNQPARPVPELAPELSLYRDHCIALLRRYFCMSVEVGRLPALLGRECFRTNAQDYHVHSFENMVLFVIDVERCLDRLDPFDKKLIALVVLQEYTEGEAARLLHVHRCTVIRRLADALDALSEMFFAGGLLPLPSYRRKAPPVDEQQTPITLQAAAECNPENLVLNAGGQPAGISPDACQAPFVGEFPLNHCVVNRNNSAAHATFTPSDLLC
jgi:hypothetical protein